MTQFSIPLLAALLLGSTQPSGGLEVHVDGIRNAHGLIHVCLIQNSKNFPDCSKDPAALRKTVPASTRTLRFSDLPPGHYAVTVFHDENGNKRLDRLMGIPREGFGFSRNPKIRFGPPKFEAVDIEVGTSVAVTDIHLLYML